MKHQSERSEYSPHCINSNIITAHVALTKLYKKVIDEAYRLNEPGHDAMRFFDSITKTKP